MSKFEQLRPFTFVPLCCCLLAVCATAGAGTNVVTIAPSKDNTLYEDVGGTLSNGAGEFLFAGRTSVSSAEMLRRAVLAFDIAGAVPAGSTILSVELTLTVSRANSGAENFDLCRLTSDWGEGDSNAGSPGGGGAGGVLRQGQLLRAVRPGAVRSPDLSGADRRRPR